MSSSLIGQPLERLDGRLKVTGEARYTADMPIPNLAHGVMLQSTIARGRIRQMDTTRAEAAPGVLAVLTPFNMPKLAPAPVIMSQDSTGTAAQSYLPLQDDAIHYYGQYIAVVIAETREQAAYAASLITVDYEQEQPVLSIQEAAITRPSTVWRQPTDVARGDVEQGMAAAAVRIEQTYVTAMQSHATIETHATIAVWEDDNLTIYEPSTFVYGVRMAVAHWLQMQQEKIRVISRFVGGSFGCKGPTWPHSVLTAVAARQVGRPVKLVLTRAHQFTSTGYRPEIQHRLRLGATQDGRFTAIVHDAIAQTAVFDERAVAPVTRTTRKVYACPNVSTSYRLAHLNIGGPGTMRGPGETPGLFALESALDELAYALNIDPLELRLRNFAEIDPEESLPWSSNSLRTCYQQGAERFGWHLRNSRPRSMQKGDMLMGWGMATMAYDVQTFPTVASARFQPDGSVVVQCSTSDQGTGSYTVMSQVAAETLGIPIADVRFELGDTNLPMAFMSAASTSAGSVGSAVQAATSSLRQRILGIAVTDPVSPLYGQQEAMLDVSDAHCFVKDRPHQGETYREILKRHPDENLAVTEHVLPEQDAHFYTRYTFGAHFAEVQIHPVSSIIRVTRYVATFGAGRILNPQTARSQLLGGIVWGIGMALMEQTALDPTTGRIINADLGEYHVPVNADIPSIDAFFVQEDDPHLNRVGAKGIGEIGAIGSAAAIANAVYHATGTRIRTLPITLDKIL
jgi:xanthine dehydrogenase YagR molybdenum-binding subunit